MSSTLKTTAVANSEQPPQAASAGRDRVLVFGVAVGTCFQIALLVLVNLYPGWVGVVSLNDPRHFVPVTSPGLEQLLPWINAWIALSLALSFVLIGLGRTTLGTRWAELGIQVFGCYVLWLLIQSGPIVAYDPSWTVTGEPLVRMEQHLVPTLNTLIRVVLWVLLALSGLGALVKALRLVAMTVYSPAADS